MRNRFHRGFTIVEIAVAVVVLSILVGLVMFSFNAAIDNARSSTLKADLAKSASNLKKRYVDSGSYPQNQAQAEEYLEGSDGVGFEYNHFTSSSYCLAGTLEDLTYYIDASRTEAVEGGCAPGGPEAPVSLTAPTISTVNVVGNQAEVSWGSVSGATGYDVRRRIGSGSWSTASSSGASYTFNSLTPGSSYQFQVRARNGGVQSSWSSTVSRVVVPTPTISSVSSIVCGTYSGTVSWFNASVSWLATSSSITASYVLEGTPGKTYGYTPKTVANTGSGTMTTTASSTEFGVQGPATADFRIYGLGANGERSAVATWTTQEYYPPYYC